MADSEYDKEQLRIMRNAFKAFDHDEKGFIEHSDVQTILEILGQKLDEKAIKALIKEVDKGNSGKLDFRQFCILASRFVEVEEDANALASELKEAFRVYDKEGKGYLTVQVLRDILHELDDKLTKNELDMIIEEIDADGSGTVDFDEFMQVMTGKNYYDITLYRRFTFEPDLIVPRRPCYCPTHRMRLHRRIEWHFERLFQNMFKPLKPDVYTETVSSSTNLHHHQHHQQHQVSLYKPGFLHAAKCCYRPVYRPRFPKWVPILTLYREILQNPFRRRGHYMLTHH